MSAPMKDILQAVLSQPPRIVVQKSIRLIRRRGLAWVDRLRDRFLPTYGNVYSDSAEPLGTYLRPPAKESLSADAEKILSLADLYLKHYFDLLGSGWVRVHYGMTCRGLEGHRYAMSSKPPSPESASILNAPNRSHSQKIRKMISAEYVPVDWQIDFKSGYRWREKRPSLKCRPAPLPGVDIKMPWELARMQHLPQLAWAFGLAIQKTEGALPAETYSHEFKNQVLDFIAANPPRFGVNWSCPMDVGIRAANWLAAYDLFRAQGATFDPDFNRVFKNSIHDHGRHIFHNLEWSPTLRSNHYLADIVGLLYIAAYLPQSRETDTWLALAVQELIREMNSQFHPDGSNFEASTSYHGLSGEMILYGTALILGLPDDKLNALKDYRPPAFTSGPRLQPAPMMFFPLPGSEKRSPLPPTHFERLERIAGFVRAATKPNGQIAQIGDNDSGRFLKLQPVYYRAGLEELQSLFRNLQDYAGVDSLTRHWVENSLNYGHLAQAIDHLLGKGENALPGFHAQIVKTLAGTPLALPP
ncbi:MAG: heparinase, partial [Nitrospinaceae bacterium]|nr:heparinase [Nitrospinaceae bacterium]